MSEDSVLKNIALVLTIVFIILIIYKYMEMQKPCNNRCFNQYKKCVNGCNCSAEHQQQEEGFGNPNGVGSVYPNVVGDVNEDHSDRIKDMALESDVSSSHKRFVKDTHHRTTGASKASIHSSDIHPNTFVGLRRPEKLLRERYAQTEARVTHSEYPEDMGEYSEFCLQ